MQAQEPLELSDVYSSVERMIVEKPRSAYLRNWLNIVAENGGRNILKWLLIMQKK